MRTVFRAAAMNHVIIASVPGWRYDPLMVERTAIIRNSAGIHCRPSACIVKATGAYPGEITVRAPSGECDPRSIMALISLGIDVGTEITIRVEGPDEEEQCARLVELFETHFDFPHRHPGEDTQSLLGDLRSSP